MQTKFNRFTDISWRPLRIYNRSVFYCNLFEDQGKVIAEEYAQSFSDKECLEMAQMIALVRKIGVKKVQQLVTEGVDFVDDEYVEARVLVH